MLRFAVAAVVEQPTVDMVAPPVPPADPATPSKATLPLGGCGGCRAADGHDDLGQRVKSQFGRRSTSSDRRGIDQSGERTAAPAVRRSLLAPEASTDSALDTFFVELWDQDQLLFPDAGPPIDETLFPDGFPAPDDMPGPGDISSALEHSL